MCCSVLQRVWVSCSECVAVRCSVCVAVYHLVLQCVIGYWSVLQCVIVYWSVSLCVAMCRYVWSMLILEPPPPPGGVSFMGGFQMKSLEKDNPPGNNPNFGEKFGLFWKGSPLPPGWSCENHPKRKLSREKGVPTINVCGNVFFICVIHADYHTRHVQSYSQQIQCKCVHIHEWVMSHKWRSHVAHTRESCHIWDVTSDMRCQITYSKICDTYEWDSFTIFMTWLIHMCDARKFVIHMNETLKYSDYIYDMTHSHVWRDVSGQISWLIRVTFDMGRRITHVNESYHKYEWVMPHTMSHALTSLITHMNASCRK